jgi:molybdopterin-guanine dinucleotide biosynthesis protein A
MGGGDKSLLRLGGVTLLDRVTARLEPQVPALALNANGDPARFATCGLPVLPDTVPGQPGPLAGVLAGLDWAAGQGADWIVTVPADTPFLPRDLVARLLASSDGAAPVLAATRGDGSPTRSMAAGLIRHPTCGLWPVALRRDLRAALGTGTRKVAAWADGHGARVAVFDAKDSGFFNINTPEDLLAAETSL